MATIHQNAVCIDGSYFVTVAFLKTVFVVIGALFTLGTILIVVWTVWATRGGALNRFSDEERWPR